MSESKSFEIFTPLVSSFRLSEPKNLSGYEKFNSSSYEWVNSFCGEIKMVPDIWFQPDEKLSPKSFQVKLQKWLLRLGIAVDDDITGIVTDVIAVLTEDGHSLLQSLQLLEEHVFEVDLMSWHVFPTLAGDGWNGQLTRKGFHIGRLDSQKLAYYCKKAEALNHEKDAKSLHGLPAFWASPRKHKIIDVGRLFWTLKTPSAQKNGVVIIEALMQCTAALHRETMWEEFEDAFLLPFALGAPIFEISSLRFTSGSEFWCCYSGVGNKGRQTWIYKGVWVQSERMPSDWGQVQRYLQNVDKRHNLDGVPNSRLRGLVNQVARSIARSNSHMSAARIDESFLFLIVALEQVFSQKENTTKSVSTRAALVTHHAIGLKYPEAVKRVGNLYDRRSGDVPEIVKTG